MLETVPNLAPSPATLTGRGKAFGSFGEIVQGRLSSDDDFLVTLPINVWNACRINCAPANGPRRLTCRLEKSRALAKLLLADLDVTYGYDIRIEFERNLPVGKGLSSSTADMLAVVRAFEDAFGVVLSRSYVSRTFARLEPHDGLHFDTCVAYDHRSGTLLRDLGYIPQYVILAVDFGGTLDTLEYNRTLAFGEDEKLQFDRLLERLEKAFAERDDAAIASCAHQSTLLHADRHNNALLFDLMRVANNLKSLGVINAHSGTFAGLLYPRDLPVKDIKELVAKLQDRFSREVFVTRTLHFMD